jgi:transposase
LSEAQRWAIITLHRDGKHQQEIAKKIGCSLKTVMHWINYYDITNTVKEKHRTGCKRKTDENTNINIAVTTELEPFKRPKQIKAVLDLDVSCRTIDRRLLEAGKPGRVAKKEHNYSAAQLRARVSFGEGYQRWGKDDWSLVLFSDETHIEMGEHGQVWVRRPVGEALNPEYMANREPIGNHILIEYRYGLVFLAEV